MTLTDGVLTINSTGYYLIVTQWFCGNWSSGDWWVFAAFKFDTGVDDQFGSFELGNNFNASAVHFTVAPQPRAYLLNQGTRLKLYCRKSSGAPGNGNAYIEVIKLT